MKRKFEDVLVSWKNKHSRKPALIYGARQIGKTTSINILAKNIFRTRFISILTKQGISRRFPGKYFSRLFNSPL